MPPPPPPPPPGPPPPPAPPTPMGVPAAAMDAGRIDLMQSLKGTTNKRMLKPVPRKEKKHFNMIEMLKMEEKKKKGGIGVSSKAKTTSETASTSKVASKPTASELLAIKLKKKDAQVIEKKTVERVTTTKTVTTDSAIRCSTTDEELEALFSAIDKEIIDDPDAALDLLDVLEDNPEESEEIQMEINVLKSNIYLPPEDEYDMEVDEVEDKEDEEMKEMLALIENAKGEIDTTKEEELLKMMDRLDDEEYFEKLKSDVMAEEKARLEAEANKNLAEIEAGKSKIDEDAASNKRRADDSVTEKEPSKKKTKDTKKKKALAVGGVSLFGGKDLFGGKNPFAARKQESSSEEEGDDEEQDETEAKISNESNAVINGNHSRLPPPSPPPPMPSVNIAVQPDSEEKPVSFDDLPTNSHVISSSNKNRATLPSKRRPPGRIARPTNGHLANGHSEITSDSDKMGKLSTNESDDKTNKLTDRLALPNEDNDYDGDESEMSHSQIKRGRRSIKKRQPPKGGLSPFGKSELADGRNSLTQKQLDRQETEVQHSIDCDSSGIHSLTAKEVAEREKK